jgi:hypothetical protein
MIITISNILAIEVCDEVHMAAMVVRYLKHSKFDIKYIMVRSLGCSYKLVNRVLLDVARDLSLLSEGRMLNFTN